MPRIKDLNRLELGQVYYIITKSQRSNGGIIDLDYLKICRPLKFVDIINSNDECRYFYFIDPMYEKDDAYTLNENSNFFIFTNIDAFYKYVQTNVHKVEGSEHLRGGYRVYIKSEVKPLFEESQHVNPVEWI